MLLLPSPAFKVPVSVTVDTGTGDGRPWDLPLFPKVSDKEKKRELRGDFSAEPPGRSAPEPEGGRGGPAHGSRKWAPPLPGSAAGAAIQRRTRDRRLHVRMAAPRQP